VTGARRSGGAIRKRTFWAGVVTLAVPLLTVLAALAALSVRPIDAPDWLKSRVEARLAEALPELALEFSAMRLRLDAQAQLRITVWDTRIATAGGVPVAKLSDIEAALALTDLARGRLAPRALSVSGAFVTLARRRDGRIGLALGDGLAGLAIPDIPTLVTLADAALGDPRLAGLSVFEADALTVRFEDMRARRGWTLDGGRLMLRRSGDLLDLYGDFALLGGGDVATTIELNAESVIGEADVDFGILVNGLPARDLATQSPALAWLAGIDGPIEGALRSRLGDDGTLGAFSATLRIGAGALAPNPSTRPLPFDSAYTYFTYDPEDTTLRFDEIAVASPLGRVTAAGTVALQAGPDGWPEALSGQLQLSRIETAAGMAGPSPIAIEGADAAFKLTLAPFHFELGHLILRDQGLPIRLVGDLAARDDGWALALDATATRLAADTVIAHWPEAVTPRTRRWVADNIAAGTLENVRLALRAQPGEQPRLFTDARFTDVRVRYNSNLPPLEAAEGRLTVAEDRLAVRLDRGEVRPDGADPIAVGGSRFSVPDLTVEPRMATLALDARGAIPDLLRFVDNPAWRVLQRAGLGTDLAQGVAGISGSVVFPMRRGNRLEDVALDLVGTLRAVRSESLLPDQALMADSIALRINEEGLALSGPVDLGGILADAEWRQSFDGGEAALAARVSVTPELVARFAPDLPEDVIGGVGDALLALRFDGSGAPGFTLESDLSGVSIDLPALGWRLSEAETGDFTLSGTFDRESGSVLLQRLALEAPGLSAEGGPSADEGTAFALSRLQVGEWLDVAATLGPGAIVIRSGTLDLGQGLPSAGGGNGGQRPAVDVTLDRVRVTDTLALTEFEGRFGGEEGLSGEFTARVGGSARVRGVLEAADGPGWRLRLSGRDAGDIIKGAGLGSAVDDGRFSLEIAPAAGNAGGLDGVMRIDGARLRGAPGIAALLDAISIVGLIDQLNGPGIYFDEIEAAFRLQDDTVTLSSASAVGPSMGVSLDGYLDLADDTVDLQGVLSPVYILNGIGRLIARKGEGLIGFTFTVTGSRSAPRVFVNPLSALTPGMFREIFRRPPPDL
jgi:hypothetical protein